MKYINTTLCVSGHKCAKCSYELKKYHSCQTKKTKLQLGELIFLYTHNLVDNDHLYNRIMEWLPLVVASGNIIFIDVMTPTGR